MIKFIKVCGFVVLCFFVLATCKKKEHKEKVNKVVSVDPRIKSMILIPAGEFIMGNNEVKSEEKGAGMGLRKPFFLDEHPQRKIFVQDFYIDKFEVTNAEYKKFADAVSLPELPDHWVNGTYPQGQERHPVIYTNWFDAVFYCSSIGKRLPAEAEWEKAARGLDGRRFVWGNEFDEDKGNFGLKRNETVPVGSFPGDVSPFGVYDMAGNVKEWTADWYEAYPGSDYTSENFGKIFRVMRGYSYIKYGHYFSQNFVYTTHRFNVDPRNATSDVGFRCALSADEVSKAKK